MVLDPLAQVDDLDVRISGGIPAGDLARAEALLADVSAAVRAYTGQEFTAGTSTDQLVRPRNGIVRLPQRPVTAVGTVTDLNANTLFYTWLQDDRVEVSGNVPDSFAFEPWRNGITRVFVTYDHGYEEIPGDIIAVVCQIAARALGRSPDEAGVTQESIAGYSYTIGTAAGSGPLGMLPDERAVLDRYTHPQIGSIRVGP